MTATRAATERTFVEDGGGLAARLQWQEESGEQGDLEAREQAHGAHGPERFYLYEYDADQDQAMEEQYEDAGVDGATESFLLPELRFTTPYPQRCQYIGPMGWDLVDPKGQVKPSVIALTKDGRRFLVGHADWPEDESRTLAEHWQAIGGPMRTTVVTKWMKWRRELQQERKRRG